MGSQRSRFSYIPPFEIKKGREHHKWTDSPDLPTTCLDIVASVVMMEISIFQVELTSRHPLYIHAF